MTADIVSLAKPNINKQAIEIVEILLANLQSGAVVAIGIVGVRNSGEVTTAYSHTTQFHQLNSGAAILANRIAMVGN